MNQQQMHTLLDVPVRTLRDWKKGNRGKLYQLLETLDYETAEKLLSMSNNLDLKKFLENENNYSSLRELKKTSMKFLFPVEIVEYGKIGKRYNLVQRS